MLFRMVFVMLLLVFVQMVPAIVVVIPVLLTFRFLGLKDTIAALVIVNVAFWIPLITWLMRNVFRDVPSSSGNFPHSRAAAEQTLAIPIFPELTPAQMEQVVEVIASAVA